MGVGAPSKGTEAELRRVDLELPTAFFESAKGAGVQHASVLTAVGANKDAR